MDLKQVNMLRFISNDYGDNHSLRTRDISPENIGSFINVPHTDSNCFRFPIVTFLEYKVTYKIVVLCTLYMYIK